MDNFIYNAYSIFYQLLQLFPADFGVSHDWAYFACFLFAGLFVLVSGCLVCWTFCKFAQSVINRFIRWGDK